MLVMKTNYIYDYVNYYDISMIILSIYGLINISLYGQYRYSTLKFISIAMLFIRSVFYLKIFQPFRYLIYMLVEVIKGSFTTILLFLYFVIFFTFVKQATFNDKNIMEFFWENYYTSLGELMDDNEIDKREAIFKISFYVYVTTISIILLNFLIAKVSNKYSQLEINQNMIYY